MPNFIYPNFADVAHFRDPNGVHLRELLGSGAVAGKKDFARFTGGPTWNPSPGVALLTNQGWSIHRAQEHSKPEFGNSWLGLMAKTTKRIPSTPGKDSDCHGGELATSFQFAPMELGNFG